MYYHCAGCEKILNKDFDICHECFTTGEFLIYHPMRPITKTTKKYTDNHHIGNLTRNNRSAGCSCHAGGCEFCKTFDGQKRCRACSCVCHQEFMKKIRHRLPEENDRLLSRCRLKAGSLPIPYAGETIARMQGTIIRLDRPTNSAANIVVDQLEPAEPDPSSS